MRDFVSPITTHAYVDELERRIARLEGDLIDLRRSLSSGRDASAVITPAKPRNEYMRDYMAERRKKAREKVA